MRSWTLAATLLMAFVLAPASLAHPIHLPDDPQLETCGGQAPTVTACSTGAHILIGHGEHTVYVGPGFTGRIQSVLQPVVTSAIIGVVSITCDLLGGHLIKCEYEGQLETTIGPGVPFIQQCNSYKPFTFDEGGSGFWACSMSHHY